MNNNNNNDNTNNNNNDNVIYNNSNNNKNNNNKGEDEKLNPFGAMDRETFTPCNYESLSVSKGFLHFQLQLTVLHRYSVSAPKF